MRSILAVAFAGSLLIISGCNQQPSTADDALVIAQDAQYEAEQLKRQIAELEARLEEIEYRLNM